MPAVVIVSKVSQGGQKIEPFSQIGKRINGSKWEGTVFHVTHPKFGERKKKTFLRTEEPIRARKK